MLQDDFRAGAKLLGSARLDAAAPGLARIIGGGITQSSNGEDCRPGSLRQPALDTQVAHFYDGKRMEVDFTPDLEAKLTRLAAEQGCDTKALVRDAVERFVNYDEWFIREVEKGLAAADRGEFIEHEEIGKLIDRRYPG